MIERVLAYVPVIFPMYVIAAQNLLKPHAKNKVTEKFGDHSVLSRYLEVMADVAVDLSLRLSCLATFMGGLLALIPLSASHRFSYFLLGIVLLSGFQLVMLRFFFGKGLLELVENPRGTAGWKYSRSINVGLIGINVLVAFFIFLVQSGV